MVVCRKPALKKELKDIPLMKQVTGDEAVNLFTVYPNPVKAGSPVNIKWKTVEAGNYNVELLNRSGQLVFSKNIRVDGESNLLELSLPAMLPGVYFLRINNTESAKTFSREIIVE